MTELEDNVPEEGDVERFEQAAQWFVRLRSQAKEVEDVPDLKRWIESDPQNAIAFEQVRAAWEDVGTHSSAPEIMVRRRDALEESREAGARRWRGGGRLLPRTWQRFVAACIVAVIALGSWAWVSSRADVYATALGERRTLTLPDDSIITLDALSRVRVEYSDKERLIRLEEGRAQFTVAKDPLRPFRVYAGKQTVVALGTEFNVELVANTVLVTLIEGHVAVAGINPKGITLQPAVLDAGWDRRIARYLSATEKKRGTVELSAGEGLQIRQDGEAVLVRHVDIARADAWESGKLFFDNELLASAVARINRYAHRQIEVAPDAAAVRISGVFNAGDTNAFVEAVTAYFPLEVKYANDSEIRLAMRK